jgi:hypothetical protein
LVDQSPLQELLLKVLHFNRAAAERDVICAVRSMFEKSTPNHVTEPTIP